YTLTAQDANSCSISQTVALNFVNNPTLGVSNASVCPSESATLSVSGANNYSWQPGAIVSSTISNAPNATIVYTVIGEAQACVSTTTAQILVYNVPILTFDTFSITCANLGSATVAASGGTGSYSYTWAPGAQSGSIATNLNPGNYSLSVLDIGTG